MSPRVRRTFGWRSLRARRHSSTSTCIARLAASLLKRNLLHATPVEAYTAWYTSPAPPEPMSSPREIASHGMSSKLEKLPTASRNDSSLEARELYWNEGLLLRLSPSSDSAS